MIEPATLIASAEEIDNRMGPIPGRSSDRIARELRQAAEDIRLMRDVTQVTDAMVERAWAAVVGSDVAPMCHQASVVRGDIRTALETLTCDVAQPTSEPPELLWRVPRLVGDRLSLSRWNYFDNEEAAGCEAQALGTDYEEVRIVRDAAQPPAAPVPPEVMERRRKGLSDYEKPPLGQPPSWLQEQEKIPAPHNGSSADRAIEALPRYDYSSSGILPIKQADNGAYLRRADVLAVLRTEPQALSGTRPAAFLAWARETFGPVATVRGERLMRFIEEAIELAHADEMERATLDALADRVYSRPQGEITKEIGQAQACLETYAENIGESSDLLTELEWQRVQRIPRAEWDRRHKAKQEIGIALADPSSPLTRPAPQPVSKTEGK